MFSLSAVTQHEVVRSDIMDKVNVVVYEPDTRRASEKIRDLQAGLEGVFDNGYEVMDTGSKYRASPEFGHLDLLRRGKMDLLLVDLHAEGAQGMLEDIALAAAEGARLPLIVLIGHYQNGEAQRAVRTCEEIFRPLIGNQVLRITSASTMRQDGYLEAMDLPGLRTAVSAVYHGH